jgi:hypothetical protein
MGQHLFLEEVTSELKALLDPLCSGELSIEDAYEGCKVLATDIVYRVDQDELCHCLSRKAVLMNTSIHFFSKWNGMAKSVPDSILN